MNEYLESQLNIVIDGYVNREMKKADLSNETETLVAALGWSDWYLRTRPPVYQPEIYDKNFATTKDYVIHYNDYYVNNKEEIE